MAIDYIINMGCPVQETLSLEGMITMIKNRNRAAYIIDLAKNDGKTEEEALERLFNVHLITPDGNTETKDIKVRDLLESTAPLNDLKTHCTECQANKPGQSFGCYMAINYPISGKAEEWLVELSKNALEKGVPNSLLLNYIIDQKVKGDRSDRMRKDPGGTFFENQKPLEVVVKKALLNKKAVNTNQILDMFFSFQVLSLPHMVTLLYFSGAFSKYSTEDEATNCQQAIKIISEDGTNIWLGFDLKDSADDDKTVSMLKDFLRSVFIAYGLQQEMIVWP